MAEFSKDRYGVDVLKVEVPVNMKFVEGASVCTGPAAYTRDEAKKHFLAAATATNKPFIYLSAGVSNAEFTETLELVAESGVKYRGRAVRPRDMEGRDPRLRQAGRGGVPEVARDGRRREHLERQQGARAARRPWFRSME